MGKRRRAARAAWLWVLLPGIALLTAGCSVLLPKSKERVRAEWDSFAEAEAAYDRIVAYETTRDELAALGFDPDGMPNVRNLDYLELIRTLVPIGPLTRDDLPDSMRQCIDVRDLCRGLAVDISVRKSERLGFVLLDMFRFRRKVHITGWDFAAVAVLVDDLVVYKTWHGVRAIDEFSDRVQPLGPLQDPFELIVGIFGPN